MTDFCNEPYNEPCTEPDDQPIDLVVISRPRAINIWQRLRATHNGHTYWITVVTYERETQRGIGGGRIVNLSIENDEGETVTDYREGWNTIPATPDVKAVYLAVRRQFS